VDKPAHRSGELRPEPGRDIARIAFEAGVHVVGRMPGGTAQLTMSVMPYFLDEGRKLGDAVVDVADDPGLRDALGLG
jgi:hypothetical protein